MAYSRVWDEAAPDGATTLASDIDRVFQNLKADLRERMNSLGVDFTTDPVQSNRHALVRRSAVQTITTATITAVSWQTAVDNPGGMFDLAGHPTRLTVPALPFGVAGRWRVSAQVEWVASATNGGRRVFLKQDGTTVVGCFNTGMASDNGPVSCPVEAVLTGLAAGTYFEVYVYQDTGGNLDVTPAYFTGLFGAGAYATYFDLMQIP